MKNLIIVGTGGFALEMYDPILNSLGCGTEYKPIGFLEGDIPCRWEHYGNLPLPVLENVINYTPKDDDVFTIVIGDPYVREKLSKLISGKGGKFVNIIHKTAVVSCLAKLGEGVILAPFSTVNGNAVIGNQVVINSCSGIAHDCVIGDYTCIMGQVVINGHTTVGTHTYWGTGAATVPHSKIGNGAKIGAMSLVLRSVKENVSVFGIPAKRL